MLAMPAISFATDWAGLVLCNNTPIADGSIPHPCDFKAFMTLINTVINFILVDMAIPIAAIMFAYAGFELVTSAGSTEKIGTAKNVFTNAVLGLAIAAAAWIIVKLILTTLGYNDLGTFFNL